MSNQLITHKELEKYIINNSYKRNGKNCIFDIIRQILVVATPEEIIRQKIILYLINELNVPKDMIDVEVPMTNYKMGAKGRADIIVSGSNEKEIYPLVIIECKAPGVPISGDVWDQIYKYDEIIEPVFLIVSNSIITEGTFWHSETKEYKVLKNLPNYMEMLGQYNLTYYDRIELWKRPNFNDLDKEETISAFYENGWIGEDTDKELIPFVMNLCGFIQDASKKLYPIEFKDINIIDSGIRSFCFGNAGGGVWDSFYRYFILEDEFNNNQIVSISLLGSMKTKNDPHWGTRKGITTLIVAIDDFDKRHNSLQLNVDKYVYSNEEECIIWHDGTLTKGKKGAVKKSKVIEFIENKSPELVYESKIILGKFKKNVEISWEQTNTKEFIYNLIKYALLRDEYRKI